MLRVFLSYLSVVLLFFLWTCRSQPQRCIDHNSFSLAFSLFLSSLLYRSSIHDLQSYTTETYNKIGMFLSSLHSNTFQTNTINLTLITKPTRLELPSLNSLQTFLFFGLSQKHMNKNVNVLKNYCGLKCCFFCMEHNSYKSQKHPQKNIPNKNKNKQILILSYYAPLKPLLSNYDTSI